MSEKIYSFEVSVKGRDWTQIVNAKTPGKAKREYHRSVTESWPSIPFTAMRCRKIGEPHTSDQFKRNAQYRGMPDLECGQRVKVGISHGTVVGHDASANIVVLFDEDSKYKGSKLSVHPDDLELSTPK